MISADRSFILHGLREALTTLASPGGEALLRAPTGSVRADELALDFENFAAAFLSNFGNELSEEQRSSVKRVDQLLDSMSGATNGELWTDAAVLEHPAWADVREAALRALELLAGDVSRGAA